MNITNLSEDNVKQIENFIQKLQVANPEIEYEIVRNVSRLPVRVPTMQDVDSLDEIKKSIEVLTEKVEALENLLKRTLDGHILINGSWAKIVDSKTGLVL